MTTRSRFLKLTVWFGPLDCANTYRTLDKAVEALADLGAGLVEHELIKPPDLAAGERGALVEESGRTHLKEDVANATT
jgi:hypothetical protein